MSAPAGTEREKTDALALAAGDLRYLLGAGYPREKVLALVGDRHGLDHMARRLLRRGVHAPKAAQRRRQRLLKPESLTGRLLGVDGHNVVITLETALKRGRLVLADDGLVRDIGEVGRHHRPGPETYRAVELMLDNLLGLRVKGALIWLDAPLTKSGLVAQRISRGLESRGLAGFSRAVPVPETELTKHDGPVATSDSALVDAVDEPVDLAGIIIRAFKGPVSLERL